MDRLGGVGSPGGGDGREGSQLADSRAPPAPQGQLPVSRASQEDPISGLRCVLAGVCVRSAAHCARARTFVCVCVCVCVAKCMAEGCPCVSPFAFLSQAQALAIGASVLAAATNLGSSGGC